jgi:hypothetical protein
MKLYLTCLLKPNLPSRIRFRSGARLVLNMSRLRYPRPSQIRSTTFLTSLCRVIRRPMSSSSVTFERAVRRPAGDAQESGILRARKLLPTRPDITSIPRGIVTLRSINVGILSEAPGLGSTVIAIAFIAQARQPRPEESPYVRLLHERNKERLWRNTVVYGDNVMQIKPPSPIDKDKPFCAATVVVAHHGIVDDWSKCLSAHIPGREVLTIARNSDLSRFVPNMMALPEFEAHMSNVIFVVSMTSYSLFRHAVGDVRFGRVFYDHPSTLNITNSFTLNACHVWLIEPHMEAFILKFASAPDQPRTKIMKETFEWHLASLKDMSPLILGHGWSHVVQQLGVTVPNHVIYRCKDAEEYIQYQWSRYLQYNPTMRATNETERMMALILRLGADIVSTEEAVELTTSSEAQARVQQWRNEACIVCWTGLRDAACVMQCCFQLMCMSCTNEVVRSSGSCPTCRDNLLGSDYAMLTVTDDEAGLGSRMPERLSFAPSALNKRRLATLSRIIQSLDGSSRVILYINSPLSFMYQTNTPPDVFVESHGVEVMKLSGNRYHITKTIKWFAPEGSDRGRVILLRSDSLGCGTDLTSATDVVFFSPASTATYRDIVMRGINARCPGRSPLKVHYIHRSGDPVLKFYLPMRPKVEQDIGDPAPALRF